MFYVSRVCYVIVTTNERTVKLCPGPLFFLYLSHSHNLLGAVPVRLMWCHLNYCLLRPGRTRFSFGSTPSLVVSERHPLRARVWKMVYAWAGDRVAVTGDVVRWCRCCLLLFCQETTKNVSISPRV